MRIDLLACVLLVSVPGCADDAPATTTTTTGEVERELFDGSVERWMVDADAVAHGGYRLETSDGWLLREGTFVHGQPDGAWTDWYGPDALPSATPQKAMVYGFAAGLADGAFSAWEPDGTLRWERSWAAGKPCGLWKSYGDAAGDVEYPPCEGSVAVDLEDLALVSPVVTDFGWDGETCPSGTARVEGKDPETGGAALAAYCARGEVPDGPYLRRSAGGLVVEVGGFASGQKSGLWVRYHPRATELGDVGQRVAEAGEYVAGVREGPWFVYRADGTLELEGDYRAGLRQGAWEGYAQNLLLAWAGDYEAGDKTGTWRTYHADWMGGFTYAAAGTIATEETWVGGVRHGPFTHWFRGGGKAREGEYVNGVLGGVLTSWWEDGTKRFETTYVGGVANGPHKQWDEAGRLEAEGRYELGAAVGEWQNWVEPNFPILFFGGPYARTGSTVTWVDGVMQGPIEARYEDGGLAFESQLVDGKDEGPGTFYWPSGQVLAEGMYQGGGAQGPWQSYYESGAPRATWPWVNNLLAGPFVEYHENGQKRREGTYNSGIRIGTWTSWDEAGVVVDTEDCGAGGEGCDCSVSESCQ